MRYKLEEVQDRMLRAWDDVHILAATARHVIYGAGIRERNVRPAWRFVPDLDIRYEASETLYWQAPDRLRFQELVVTPSSERFGYEYLAVGPCWWRRGQLESVYIHGQHLVKNATRYVGQTLTPEENAHYPSWINPASWVKQMQFVVIEENQGPNIPLISHLLAGNGWEFIPEISGTDDGEEIDDVSDITKSTTFCQLWVDMATGFFTRLTGENDNGRVWDILVDSVRVNDDRALLPDCFQPPPPKLWRPWVRGYRP